MTLGKTFRRVEDKYIISEEQMKVLLRLAGDRLHPDKYPTSNMHNLYFDTKDHDLIVGAIDSNPFRKKVRIRSYVEPRKNSDVFVEIKTKLKKKGRKISGKRRFTIKLADFEKYMAGKGNFEKIVSSKDRSEEDAIEINTAKNVQIAREVDYLIKHFELFPQIFITYDRESYAGEAAYNEWAHNKDAFRITFDKHLRYRTNDLSIFKTENEINFFKNDKKKDEKNIIMEVKTLGAMPLWFVQILSKLEIYPQPFSKYGRIYQQIKGGEC